MPWPARPYEPERLALASLYLSLTGLVSRPITAGGASPGHRPGQRRPRGDRRPRGRPLRCNRAAFAPFWIRPNASAPVWLPCAPCERASMPRRKRARPIRPIPPIPLPSPTSRPIPRRRRPRPRCRRRDAPHRPRIRAHTPQPTPVAEAERLLEAFRSLPADGEPAALIADIRAQMDALTRQLRVTFDLANHATPSGSLAFARTRSGDTLAIARRRRPRHPARKSQPPLHRLPPCPAARGLRHCRGCTWAAPSAGTVPTGCRSR